MFETIFTVYRTLHSFKEVRTVDSGQDYIVLFIPYIQPTTASSFTPTNVQILLIDLDLDSSGCIGPQYDAILICFELPPLLAPR